MIGPAEVASIERATVAAVAPEAVAEVGGWIVALGGGTIGRARAAAPLRHDLPADEALLDEIEGLYRARGLPGEFRIAQAPGLADIQAALRRRGFAPYLTTLTMVGSARSMRAVTALEPAEIIARPDPPWGEVFLGEGFDPVDGAFRVAALSRSPDAVYACVREGPLTLAVGVAAFGHGWASVHGMRTDRARRGEGLAARVLAALADAALARGIDRVFLQVDAANAPAIALYRRAGFEVAWPYEYWRRDADAPA